MERSLGILVNGRTIRRFMMYHPEREHLDLYHRFAEAMNIQVFFIQPESLQLEEGKTKAYYFNRKMELVNCVIPLPKAIYNRSINLKSDTINKVRKLRSQKISTLFNPVCRFSLIKAIRILQTNEELIPFLPKIQVLSANTQEQLPNYHQLVYREKGPGKKLVEMTKREGLVHYQAVNKGKYVKGSFSEDNWKERLNGILGRGPYMVRECIPFPKWQGHPYVFHTGYQKNEHGKWSLNGLISLLYSSKSHPIKTKPKPFSINQMADDQSSWMEGPSFELMKLIGLKSAMYLEAFLPQLSDISFDFVISPTGDLFLFDLCLMERKELYHEAEEWKMWENSYKQPVAYGKFLLQQRSGGHLNE
ncbi:YheC/YheD family protein [Ammoniphilus resinae]|uniref:Uncharacterized protein n=1 Tax=Ammoniphilus resinae TaxID=861532 RepID=A0ABS4GT21_9BACL|nr:YheC/YheD family protein [Ammoniphilus resinae]MBP1933384.1 hypothetical protein [Ammoniphilus resinae]